jgi:purine-nucleoside phosphorylase
MTDLYDMLQESVNSLRGLMRPTPQVALILGTGLGRAADRIIVAERAPYGKIPYFPVSTVEGHDGELVFGTLAGWDIVAMKGRAHYYEGHPLSRSTFPVRALRMLGAELLIINSAAGGLNPDFTPGDVMTVEDHINLIPDNPLRGVHDPRLGERFPDMSRPYDSYLIEAASDAARQLNIALRRGVYAALTGPSLETRAETRMLRMLGADAVGMSIAPEVIVASAVGFRTVAFAVITNVNIPDAMAPVEVGKVIEAAEGAAPRLSALIEGMLRQTPRPPIGSLKS